MNEQGSVEFQSELIPVLREGVEVVKMILYLELRDAIAGRYIEAPPAYVRKLTGAVINELFGTPNLQAEFLGFAEENRDIIDAELSRLGSAHEKMRIPLTDALRTQYLCDTMEGIDNRQVLLRARELRILLSDREVPLPNKFLFLVRTLAAARGLIREAAVT